MWPRPMTQSEMPNEARGGIFVSGPDNDNASPLIPFINVSDEGVLVWYDEHERRLVRQG